ncbi:TIGR00730 family Rossman fold protein [Parapusillimonas granuli]|uniref:Cytokinin riboside 5'-monophosphate phosphoribohydrolase n=1 Tax=Parapusillimonas granuli TaxID=380911 RepID=A0A853FX27_9BURK|nr:TIGR00730 family Rossman fold protein [Parapusillimonas granuli]MBB5214164.1 hypothetical protein [Parapusillimonas granuli]NYT50585.1 TIGR00730 family Rossman fold protein [Parapusillimonas granuli]
MNKEERQSLVEKIRQGSAYRTAPEDLEWLNSDETRALRLQLEYLKVEHALLKHKITRTVVVYGSARIMSPETAQAYLAQARELAEANPRDREMVAMLADAERQVRYSHYYNEARRFTHLMSELFQNNACFECAVVTGGGPGIMEAANRGAYEVGARTIGLNITLPHEQEPNPYITPELAFHFRYFALRKMHFLLRARALVAFPGGYGTLDELFEVLTLVQTRKMDPIPILLFGKEFWDRAIDLDFLAEQGMISHDDAALVTHVEQAEDAVEILANHFNVQASPLGGCLPV